jgi:polyisoprenyl-teichoic acid--peptidoglycan teichoic acid transferase
MLEPILRRRAVGPLAAAALSFVWPGLGQLATGRRRTAAALGIPALILILWIASRLVGRLDLAAITMLDPTFAAFLVFAIVAMAGWRSIAVIDAWRAGVVPPATARAKQVLSGLLVAILLTHAVAGYYAWAFYDAGRQIFAGSTEPTPPPPTPTPAPLPSPSGSDGAPSPTPELTFPPSDRVSILLTGVDSGHDRLHALTDTMLVLTVSPSMGTVSMISFPRDIAEFPLYSGGTYRDKLNSLQTAARNSPAKYPDGPSQTLASELAFLLGIPIQYTASINLVGFERMINLVGGVDIVVERRIADPSYDWFDGTYGFFISAGKHHLDGRTALAFVRSRMGAGDNDFTRARRQQQLVVALKDKLTDPGLITKLPQLLDAAAKTVATNLTSDKAREYMELATSIDEANISRYVLGPPYAVHPPTNTTGGTYILKLDLAKVAALSVQLFGTDSRYFGTLPSPSPKR